jgi:ubiquinone/menaquinone biosynthesis C-methylase UbiE
VYDHVAIKEVLGRLTENIMKNRVDAGDLISRDCIRLTREIRKIFQPFTDEENGMPELAMTNHKAEDKAMNKAQFDHIADEYIALHSRNIKASGESPEFFARYKVEDVSREIRKAKIKAQDILDFGSGIGNSLPHFTDFFPLAAITCADVSHRSLDISRLRHKHIQARHVEIEEFKLPFQDGSFDLCFSACVFHHISHSEHEHWLAELKRVTRKDGVLIIFEHNPMNPLTVSAVRDCPFDEDAVLISAGALKQRIRNAGWTNTEAVYRMFFPSFLSFARPAEKFMRKLPLGAQYFVVARNS